MEDGGRQFSFFYFSFFWWFVVVEPILFCYVPDSNWRRACRWGLYLSLCLSLFSVLVNTANLIICEVGEWQHWLTYVERKKLKEGPLSVFAMQGRYCKSISSISQLTMTVCFCFCFFFFFFWNEQRIACPAFRSERPLSSVWCAHRWICGNCTAIRTGLVPIASPRRHPANEPSAAGRRVPPRRGRMLPHCQLATTMPTGSTVTRWTRWTMSICIRNHQLEASSWLPAAWSHLRFIFRAIFRAIFRVR